MPWRDLDWSDVGPPLAEDVLAALEAEFRIALPPSYRVCLARFHGALPRTGCFLVAHGPGEPFGAALSVLLSPLRGAGENVYSVFEGMGDGRRPGIVPIGLDGGGDVIALDYTSGDVPSVSYFEQDTASFLPVAGSFDAFCAMLRPPAEDPPAREHDGDGTG